MFYERIGEIMFKKLFNMEAVRFIIVGVVNTLFGTLIMFSFYNIFHMPYWVSSASNYIFGSILSFFLNKYFTFKNTEKSFSQVLKFIINISICYFVAYGVAKPLAIHFLSMSTVSIQENVAMLIGMVLFTLLKFFGQKFFAFKK